MREMTPATNSLRRVVARASPVTKPGNPVMGNPRMRSRREKKVKESPAAKRDRPVTAKKEANPARKVARAIPASRGKNRPAERPMVNRKNPVSRGRPATRGAVRASLLRQVKETKPATLQGALPTPNLPSPAKPPMKMNRHRLKRTRPISNSPARHRISSCSASRDSSNAAKSTRSCSTSSVGKTSRTSKSSSSTSRRA